MNQKNNKLIYILLLSVLLFSMLTGVRYIYSINDSQVYPSSYEYNSKLFDAKNCNLGVFNNIHDKQQENYDICQNDNYSSKDYDYSMNIGNNFVVQDDISTVGLFDKFFNNNQKECTANEKKYVYLGGFPLGITIDSQELIIVSNIPVNTKNGAISPTEGLDIRSGDILYKINGTQVKEIEQVSAIINAMPSNKVVITIKRNGVSIDYEIELAIEESTNAKKLGLLLQDKVAGIGTMTYIDVQTKRYGALGHPVMSNISNDISGNIFNATIAGVKKGKKGEAGELQGEFDSNTTPIGTIDKNNDFGIFGYYNASVSGLNKIELGSKSDIKPGKAHIYTTIKGQTPKFYEIEIIKVNYQATSKTKSMVIRITDSELVNIAGGIVQGMSGSPIIQENKLIGAVTHVFLNDSTKGYGLYAQWMIDN